MRKFYISPTYDIPYSLCFNATLFELIIKLRRLSIYINLLICILLNGKQTL